MLEKDLERKCRVLVITRNGELLKFISPGNKGVHDRLLILPDYMALIEFKRSRTAKVQPLQDYWQDRFTQLRVPAFRVWRLEQFLDILIHAADVHFRAQRNRDQIEFRGWK